MLERIRPLVRTLLVLGIVCAPLAAQTTKKVSFANDIAPILSQKCMQCHGLANPMANLDLKSREGALKAASTAPPSFLAPPPPVICTNMSPARNSRRCRWAAS